MLKYCCFKKNSLRFTQSFAQNERLSIFFHRAYIILMCNKLTSFYKAVKEDVNYERGHAAYYVIPINCHFRIL